MHALKKLLCSCTSTHIHDHSCIVWFEECVRSFIALTCVGCRTRIFFGNEDEMQINGRSHGMSPQRGEVMHCLDAHTTIFPASISHAITPREPRRPASPPHGNPQYNRAILGSRFGVGEVVSTAIHTLLLPLRSCPIPWQVLQMRTEAHTEHPHNAVACRSTHLCSWKGGRQLKSYGNMSEAHLPCAQIEATTRDRDVQRAAQH